MLQREEDIRSVGNNVYELTGVPCLMIFQVNWALILRSDEVDTIGGYLSMQAGHVPGGEESFTVHGWTFTVIDADMKLIRLLLRMGTGCASRLKLPTKIPLKFNQYFALFPVEDGYILDMRGFCLALFWVFQTSFSTRLFGHPLACGLRSSRHTRHILSGSTFSAGWLAKVLGAAVVLFYWLYMPVRPMLVICLFSAGFACLRAFIAFVITSQSGLFSLFAWTLKDLFPWRRAFASLGIVWYFLEYLYAAFVGFPLAFLPADLRFGHCYCRPVILLEHYATDGLWVCAALLIFFCLSCLQGTNIQSASGHLSVSAC